MTNVTTEGGEPLRLERLRSVEVELGRDICGKIVRLHDHNGVLYVDWAERPSPQDIMTVIQKWGRHEKEPVTYHYEMGVELVGTATRYNPFGSAAEACLLVAGRQAFEVVVVGGACSAFVGRAATDGSR